ncbi:MAG: flagellar basal body-associated protein FliL [Janthinobacterium lividum]
MSAVAAKGAGKAEKAEGKKSPLLMILLVVIIVLLLGGGGAAFYFFKSASHGSTTAKVLPPVFFPLDAFTVNLATDDGDAHYLHLGLTLKVEDEDATKSLTSYLPEIRSRILLLLSSKHPEDLSTVAGKNKLSEEIMKTVEQPFVKDGSHAKVNGVLFTDFVIQ